jgi:TolB protein
MPNVCRFWSGVLVVAGLSVAAAAATAAPTGGEIAYCYQPLYPGGIHQVYMINADGTGNHKLIQAGIGLNHHSWSSGGDRLAAVGYPDATTWSIYTFAADGTGLTRLTQTRDVWDSDPAWSPDGTMISFARTYPSEGYREEIWLMDSDGGRQRWIGIQGAAAQWSPDGSRLIYASQRGGVYDIFTCSIEGGDERQITQTPAAEGFPAFSPDGSRIAFARSADGSYAAWEVYVMDVDGGNECRLTDNAAYDSYPRWSPDGSLLCFMSDRSQNQHWEVYVMGADGSNVIRITQLPANVTAINPVWRP